jgi:APA family basic amino acid/polyamine antiporter
MPNPVARMAKTTHIPETAVMAVAILVSLLILLGDIRITWGLSAFAILVYYAITNLATLQLPGPARPSMRLVAGVGLMSCLFLAFWLEPRIWLTGLVVLVTGYGWRYIMRRL